MGGRLAERAALAAGVVSTLGVLLALSLGAEEAWRDWAALGPPFVTSLLVSVWALLVAFAVGVPAAVWMEMHPRFGVMLGALADGVGGLPSVVAGLIGLEVFAGFFHLGFSLLTGGLTLGLLNLPFVVRSTQGAIRGGEVWLEGAVALGAPIEVAFWGLVWPQVRGALRAPAFETAARSMGETAALYLTIGIAPGGFGLDPLAARSTLSLRLFYLLIQGRTGLLGLTSAVAFSMIAMGFLLHLAADRHITRRPAVGGRQDRR